MPSITMENNVIHNNEGYGVIVVKPNNHEERSASKDASEGRWRSQCVVINERHTELPTRYLKQSSNLIFRVKADQHWINTRWVQISREERLQRGQRCLHLGKEVAVQSSAEPKQRGYRCTSSPGSDGGPHLCFQSGKPVQAQWPQRFWYLFLLTGLDILGNPDFFFFSFQNWNRILSCLKLEINWFLGRLQARVQAIAAVMNMQHFSL